MPTLKVFYPNQYHERYLRLDISAEAMREFGVAVGQLCTLRKSNQTIVILGVNAAQLCYSYVPCDGSFYRFQGIDNGKSLAQEVFIDANFVEYEKLGVKLEIKCEFTNDAYSMNTITAALMRGDFSQQLQNNGLDQQPPPNRQTLTAEQCKLRRDIQCLVDEWLGVTQTYPASSYVAYKENFIERRNIASWEGRDKEVHRIHQLLIKSICSRGSQGNRATNEEEESEDYACTSTLFH